MSEKKLLDTYHPKNHHSIFLKIVSLPYFWKRPSSCTVLPPARDVKVRHLFFSDYIQDIPRDGQKQRQKPSLWMKQKHGRREKAKMIKRTDANVYTSTPNFWLFSIISIFPISPTKTYSLKQKNDMSQNSKVLLVTSTCTARLPPTSACRPDKKDLPRSIFGAPVCLKRDFSVESPQTCQHLLFWK